MIIEPNKLYGKKEAAEVLQCNEATIAKMVKDERLPRHKVGRHYRWSGKVLLEGIGTATE